MRVDKIIVELADREYCVWLNEKLLAITPQQAQQLADDLREAMRARWRAPQQATKPQHKEGLTRIRRLIRRAHLAFLASGVVGICLALALGNYLAGM